MVGCAQLVKHNDLFHLEHCIVALVFGRKNKIYRFRIELNVRFNFQISGKGQQFLSTPFNVQKDKCSESAITSSGTSGVTSTIKSLDNSPNSVAIPQSNVDFLSSLVNITTVYP